MHAPLKFQNKSSPCPIPCRGRGHTETSKYCLCDTLSAIISVIYKFALTSLFLCSTSVQERRMLQEPSTRSSIDHSISIDIVQL